LKSRVVGGVLVAVLAVAGCGGGSHSSSSHAHHGRPTPPPATFPGTGPSHSTTGPAAVSARLAGACSTAVSSQRALSGISNRFVSTAPEPFGIASSSDGRFAFVSTGKPAIQVIGGLPSAPRAIRTVAVPPQTTPLGLALTRDGRYLLAASGGGALVLSTARLEHGGGNAYLGELQVPVRDHPGFQRPAGGIEVTTTPDGRYAFVSLEDTRQLAVYNLQAALASGFRGSHLVGYVPTGLAPVGIVLSPDGRWLYATSEVGGPHAVRGVHRAPRQGSVTVISVPEAVTDPAKAAVATVPAGCGPVRIVTTQDGRIILVTARESDELLAFSATRLRTGAADSLVAAVRVGEAPVGVTTGAGGSEAIVADSNRFEVSGASAGLTIVDIADLLAGRPSLVGRLAAGAFPRDMSVTPNGQTLLVSDFNSSQIQIVKLAGL
jgi:DNA-binding beta-propeller fold protein YncE